MISTPSLMFHAVEEPVDDPYLLCVSPHRFEEQMTWLHSLGLSGQSFAEAARLDGAAGRRTVHLSFNDGYRSVLDAVPVLTSLGFTATIFAVSGKVGGASDWDTPSRPLLDADELRELHRLGFEIGSHGHRHVRLAGLSPQQCRDEVRRSKDALEDSLEIPVTGFCYPYGSADGVAVDAVRRAGYGYGVAVAPSPLSPRFAAPRQYVGERDGRLRLTAKLALGAVRRPRSGEAAA